MVEDYNPNNENEGSEYYSEEEEEEEPTESKKDRWFIIINRLLDYNYIDNNVYHVRTHPDLLELRLLQKEACLCYGCS